MYETNGKKDSPLQKTLESPEPKNNQGSTNPEELKSVKDLLQTLTKTSKTIKIYLSNNPIHQKHLKELTEKFTDHLETYGSFTLDVQQFQLYFQDEVVYENRNRMESIAFKFYIDGLREIIFQEGLEPDEIYKLMDIISRDFDPSNPNDDMVTLLWESNFRHIRYEVAEDLFDEEDLIQEDEKPVEDPDKSQERKKLLQREIQKASKLSETEEPQRFGGSYSKIFQLTEQEIAQVKAQMEKEEKRDLFLEMIIIVGSILRIERGEEAFEKSIDSSRKILGILIKQGAFFHACKVLELYHALLNSNPSTTSYQQFHLQKALEWAGGEENFKGIEEILRVGNLKDKDDFFRFLSLLTSGAIPSLIELLANLNQMKVRRLVCEALVVLGKDHVPILLEVLRDSRWFIIRNIVYVLGKIGDPKSLDGFRRLIHHPHERVRKEMLQALPRMPQDAIEGIYLALLNDKDRSIRQQAIRWLVRSGSQEGLKIMQRMIGEEGFKGKVFSEKKEVFESIAVMGGDSVIPFLEGFLLKKRTFWFSNHKQDDFCLCSVSALKKMKSQTALSVLQSGAESLNKVTREACKKAMG